MKSLVSIMEGGRPHFAAAGAALLGLLFLSCGGYGGDGGTAPTAFSLVDPVNGEPTTPTPVLTWTAAAGTTSYTVQVDDEITFALPRVINATVPATETMYPVSPPLAAGTYFWRVLANNYYGMRTAGPTSFVVTVP